MDSRWKCRSCGQWHTDLPFSYSVELPDFVLTIPVAQRASRVERTHDLCVVDDQYFFLRGNIELPVLDAGTVFAWNAWVSVSRETFGRTVDGWETPGRETAAPSFGWLSNNLAIYPNTLNLKTMVHTQPTGSAPLIELEPTDHPLAIEQRTGIMLERVQEIAALLLHSPAINLPGE